MNTEPMRTFVDIPQSCQDCLAQGTVQETNSSFGEALYFLIRHSDTCPWWRHLAASVGSGTHRAVVSVHTDVLEAADGA